MVKTNKNMKDIRQTHS